MSAEARVAKVLIENHIHTPAVHEKTHTFIECPVIKISENMSDSVLCSMLLKKQVINKFFLKVILFIVFSSPPPSCLEESKKKVFQLFFSLENVVKDQCRQMFMDIKGHLQKLFQSAHNAVLIA